MTHTPGPWRFDGRAIEDADGATIAWPTWSHPDAEAKANAHVMTAAPELLTASEALLLAIKDVCGVEPQRRAMIAAHRKAYGETS